MSALGGAQLGTVKHRVQSPWLAVSWAGVPLWVLLGGQTTERTNGPLDSGTGIVLSNEKPGWGGGEKKNQLCRTALPRLPELTYM